MIKLFATMLFFSISVLIVSCANDQEAQIDYALKAASELMEEKSFIDYDPSQLFEYYCGVCHGPTGNADGFNTFNLDPKPLSFQDTLFINNNDSISILGVISDGGDGEKISKMMPPYRRTLTKKERERLTGFILSLSHNGE